MAKYDVKLFEVARPQRGKQPPEPMELQAMTVEAPSIDKARSILRARLVQAKHKVRSINFGPDKAGRTMLLAYVWGK